MKITAILLFVIAGAVAADQTQIVDGNYLRYEGTQYESVFLPCLSTEVWSIAGGDELDALVDYYRNTRTGTTSEIRASLMLDIAPIDRAEHPQSQVDSVARVIAVLSISEAENEIDSCREG